MEKAEPTKPLSKFLITQAIFIGILFGGDNIFGFFEQNFFNTYLSHILGLEELYISIMVSLSAVVGLVMNLTFGILSDNTRSSLGRRKPFFFIGGIIAGLAMILYAFSPNYITAIILDVLIIGIASNAYYVTERALIPDSFDAEYRGRANSILNIIGYLGLLTAIAGFLIANEFFSVPNPSGDGTIIIQEGYLFVLTIGGGAFIICAIIGLLFIKEVPPEELPPKKAFLEEFRGIFNINELRKNNEFFKLTLAYTIFRCGIGAIMPFLFIFIFSLGIPTVNLIFSILIGFPILFYVISVLGRLSDQHGRKKYVPISILIVSIGIFFTVLVKIGTHVNLFLFYIVFTFILIGLLGLVTPLNAWAQDLLPEDKRGKFYGILNIIFTIPQIIGSMAAGIVASIAILGIPWIFPLGSMFFLLSILFFMRVKETLVIDVS